MRRTFWLVGPVMITEGGCALALAGLAPSPASLAGLALLVLVWIVTATVQVPQHDRLGHRPDPETVRQLVRGNWIRTLAWSARSVLAIWMLLAFDRAF